MTVSDPLTADEPPRSPPTHGETLDLLLIEDCATDARLLELHLEPAIRRGEVTLTRVERLTDGIALLARRRYSCLLLDLDLPDARGIATVEQIRGCDPDVAVVVITGDDRDDTAEQTLRLGVQDYLVKGRHDAGLLLRRLRFAVQHHRTLGHGRTLGGEAFANATTDRATGLANQWLFEDRLDHALAQAERTGAGLGLLVIGYETLARDGDEIRVVDDPALSRRIAEALDDGLRRSDTLAVLGDELYGVLLVPNEAHHDAGTVARRFDALLRGLDWPDLRLVPHVGIASFPEDADTGVDLRERAEQAMHRARHQGGGVCRYRMSRTASISGVGSRTGGTEDARIDLLFQPWYDLRSSRPVGIEAVPVAAGWRRLREGGDALDWGLADWQGIRSALQQFAAFRAGGLPIPALSLRCPAALLRIATFAQDFDAARSALNIDARDLHLLIDGDVLASLSPSELAQVRALRDGGHGITLDRFLDSADSFGILAVLSFDALRIGPNAVAALPPDRPASPARRSIVAAIGAASALRLDVLASGVDDEVQREQLVGLGIRQLQGDALCPAVTAAELPTIWPGIGGRPT